jgi:hypothetical protein
MGGGVMSTIAPVPQAGIAGRYKFTEYPTGGGARILRIEGQDRNTVIVTTTPTCLLVRYTDGRGGWHIQPYGFFDYYPFAADVASGLILGWEPPEGRREWPGLRVWVWRQTGRAIGKRLHAFYNRCLGGADSTVLALQRAVFAATFSVPELVFREELYGEQYLVKDVTQHRAAAVALANLWRFRYLDESKAHAEAKEEVLSSAERANLEVLAERVGVKLSLHVFPKRGHEPAPLSLDDALSMMENWRGLFSPTGEPYRSLDRTLMNLPGGVPPSLVAYLNLVHLERPVLSRSELIVLTLHEKHRFHRELPRHNATVFRSTSEDQIVRATRLVAEHTRNALSTRRTVDLKFVMGFLMDYPNEHRGNIVGLAEKSIRWHRQEQHREIEKTLSKLGNKPTEAPPILLPEDPNVRFLSSVEEVCEEGARMNNCVASYASRAVRGLCYLFHVAHAGAEATIEVDRAGRVVQAAGPANQRNAASKWGKRKLNRWGKAFPEGHENAPATYDGIEDDLYDDIPF